MKKRLRTVSDLEEAGLLKNASADPAYAALAAAYDISISDHVAGCIKGAPADDPVGRQYIPSLEELNIKPEESEDPIGDEVRSPVKGIVHRYPDRVLLKVTNICAVYCRFCFRREMVGAAGDNLADSELEEALRYIETHPEIWEVILTGGDPLVLSARRLQNLMERLGAIDHVKVIRIHSRVPIAAPNQINETILNVLSNCAKPIYVILHVNHENEISKDVQKTIQNLQKSGCFLLSQSVLLKGVNDDAYTLETLFKKLVTLHIKPYYLHHPDLAKGTSHFRVSIEEGQNIMRNLQGRISGLCLPTYVLDIPGGYGKIPIQQSYLEKTGGTYIAEDFQGGKHIYPPKGSKNA